MTEDELAIVRRRFEDNMKDGDASCQGVVLQNGSSNVAPSRTSGGTIKRKVTSEAEIERTCTQILIHDGWRYLKTDPVSRRAWGKGFGELGMADGLYMRYGMAHWSGNSLRPDIPSGIMANATVLWVEFKAGSNEAKAHQSAWHKAERERGALVWVANEDFPATVEGFVALYNSSGLRRNRLL